MNQTTTIIFSIAFVLTFSYVILSSRWLKSGMFILLGFGLVWVGVWLHYENSLLRESAESVPAVITRMKVQKNRRQGDRYDIYLEYRFPAQGVRYTDRHGVSRDTYQEVQIGDTMNLMVATANPTVTILEKHYPPRYYPPLIVIPLIIFAFSMGVSIWRDR